MFVTFAYFVFLHRKLLSFIMVPVVQRELDTFKEMVWNSLRIRAQKDTVLPGGVPNYIYSFPQKYGLEECGKKIIRFCQNWFWDISVLFKVNYGIVIMLQQSTNDNLFVEISRHNFIAQKEIICC